MEKKSTTTMSWGQLIILIGALFLFIYAFAQRVNFETQNKESSIVGFTFVGSTITAYEGENPTVIIPKSYSYGSINTITGTVTLNDRNEAFDFLQENYAVGAEGYYEFYNKIYSHKYPWIYKYSINQYTYVEGDDIQINRITEKAFSKNTKIEKVVIQDNIEKIDNFAFQYCSALKEVELSEGIKTIGDSSFWGTAIENIVIPNSVETIYAYAFFNCNNLKTVTIGTGVTNMNNGVFNACSSLKTATILSENNIRAYTTEAYQMFSRCTNLKTIFVKSSRLNYFKTTSPWDLYSSYYVGI